MDNSFNGSHDGDEGINCQALHAEGLDEWVIFVGFFVGVDVGDWS